MVAIRTVGCRRGRVEATFTAGRLAAAAASGAVAGDALPADNANEPLSKLVEKITSAGGAGRVVC